MRSKRILSFMLLIIMISSLLPINVLVETISKEDLPKVLQDTHAFNSFQSYYFHPQFDIIISMAKY